jgi:hypothetical protein
MRGLITAGSKTISDEVSRKPKQSAEKGFFSYTRIDPLSTHKVT